MTVLAPKGHNLQFSDCHFEFGLFAWELSTAGFPCLLGSQINNKYFRWVSQHLICLKWLFGPKKAKIGNFEIANLNLILMPELDFHAFWGHKLSPIPPSLFLESNGPPHFVAVQTGPVCDVCLGVTDILMCGRGYKATILCKYYPSLIHFVTTVTNFLPIHTALMFTAVRAKWRGFEGKSQYQSHSVKAKD